MTNPKHRVLKAVPKGGSIDYGQAIEFTFVFADGTKEDFACPAHLISQLLGNLSQYGGLAARMRASSGPGSLVELANMYQITNVTRAGHTDGGKLIALEVGTDQGFPIQLAMTPDQAKKTIGLLQTELLRAQKSPSGKSSLS